jgi:type IV pilus assembly protein PilE
MEQAHMRNEPVHHMKRSRVKGFTLIELMIVIVIVGILAAIAIPSYENSVKKSKRADAQSALLTFANAMERYYTTNGDYSGATASGVYVNQVPTDGGTKYYDLSVTVPTTLPDTYTLLATPTGSMSGDGKLKYTSTGIKTWDEKDDGSYSSTW